MRILHTSDWHLNERLGRIERQSDIRDRLTEIATYLEQHQVDVMLVSGDLFANTSRLESVRDAVGDVAAIFKPFLTRGGTILALSGNHDNEALFNLFREMMNLVAPTEPNNNNIKPSGRLYLYEGPSYIRLADRTGEPVQFVLLPFPTPSRYLRGTRPPFTSLEEKNRVLHDKLVETLQVIQDNHIDPHYPVVLSSHIHVRGSHTHNLYHISETEDVIFEIGDLPTPWAYMGYGHIHQPQPIGGLKNARYAGSIERLDFGEAKDEKSVVLVEVTRGTKQTDPEILPLTPTPLYKIVVNDPETDLVDLEARYPEAKRAIVSYEVNYKPGEHNLSAIIEQIERTFPRWCTRQTNAVGSQTKLSVIGSPTNIEDVPTTVRTFLENELKDHPDREDLLALAETLLANEEEA